VSDKILSFFQNSLDGILQIMWQTNSV